MKLGLRKPKFDKFYRNPSLLMLTWANALKAKHQNHSLQALSI